MLIHQYLLYPISNIPTLQEIKNDNYKNIQDLINHATDMQNTLNGALFNACQKGQFEIVKYLINKGADLQDEDECNDNALSYACEGGYLNIVKYLVSQGANIRFQDYLALNTACYYGHLNIVKYLIDQSITHHTRYNEALNTACYRGHFNIVKYLVEFIFDTGVLQTKIVNNYNKALQIAKKYKYDHIAEYLEIYIENNI